MTATFEPFSLHVPKQSNVLQFPPKLREAPPEVKRPEVKNSHDIDTVMDTETDMLWLEIMQRLTVLKVRHGKAYAMTELDDRVKDL